MSSTEGGQRGDKLSAIKHTDRLGKHNKSFLLESSVEGNLLATGREKNHVY